MANRILAALRAAREPNGSEAAVQSGAAEVQETAGFARRTAGQAAERLEQFLIAHPVATLATALAVGVAVGWWVKRK